MGTKRGTKAADVLNSKNAADRLLGLGGNDTLNGGGGNDTLEGGAGNDRLVGGSGNDVYVFTANGGTDMIIEAGVGGGIDTVRSSVAVNSLAQNVENLVLSGKGNINGTGNTLSNKITGNTGRNRLTGLAGHDTINGGAGNDTINGGTGNDSMVGGTGDDTLIWLPTDGADTKVDGGAGNDTLTVAGAVDLTTWNGGTITDIEIIAIAGSLMLTVSDVLAMSSTTDTLRIDGDGSDQVYAGSGWTRIANTTIGSQTYAQYIKDGATLRIDTDVDSSELLAHPSVRELSALDGTNGFQMSGVQFSSSGSVSGAGDVDGDGFADLIVGNGAVVFGNPAGFAAAIELSGLTGVDGFQLGFGGTVSEAGDMNGDRYDDLIIGRYVVFGGTGAYLDALHDTSGFQLSSIDGTNGFQILNETADDALGSAVAAAGDVDGDGFDDLIIGAPSADINGNNSGASYVVFGKSIGFDATIELSELTAADGFRISGQVADARSGSSVAGAGDVNGDGLDDVIVGAPSNPFGAVDGSSYVVFGMASGFTSNLDLSALDGSNGFRISGKQGPNAFGASVSGAGDVNGDGFADLIVGAHFTDANGENSGASYVVFGSGTGFGATVELSALDGTNGFQISGETEDDFLGYSASGAGDVNGDGLDDLIVGAEWADTNGFDAGASYVIFGQTSGFASNIDVSALNGVNGFQISGEALTDRAGASVSDAGDVNGDGYADLIIGTRGAQYGASYVVFGLDFNSVVDFSGTDESDTLTGTAEADVIIAGQGNDTVTGGGADVIRGGAGDDRIEVADGLFFDVDGGSGSDTLVLTVSGSLDLTMIANSKLTGIEKIDIAGSGANSLTLSLGDLFDLSDSSNTLRVDGDADDTLIMTTQGWTDGAQIGDYHVYTLGAARLEVFHLIDETVPLSG